MLIIITAPSGAGKTSITRFLLQHFPQLAFSVSAATRPQRSDEVNGVDYYFMSLEEFHQKIQNNEFIEWEMVYEGKYYGTLKTELQRIKDMNKIPILDIDVKGAIHVQQQYEGRTLSLFVQPPSIEELKRRLELRATESPEALQDRLNKAAYEISFRQHFDRIIINDDLERACQEAGAIISGLFKEEGIPAPGW
ncbi:MAG: guanylate kinase [Bacteroidota bacterium]|nr:guanylate kinase [Bacteroidota bacterium]MDP4214136.1 guanylate kinase [Bacteroidota bacterium]MDP4249916.1 guanylate kinase [Bacteroidota bacterium]